jgi:hypothetical protein
MLLAVAAALTLTGCEVGEKPQPPKTEVRTQNDRSPRQPDAAPHRPQSPAATTTAAETALATPAPEPATTATTAAAEAAPPAPATEAAAVSDEARRALPEPLVAALEAARRDIAATAAPTAASVPVRERIQSARAILDNFSAAALAAPGLDDTQRALLTEFATTKKYIDWEEHGEAQTPEQYAEFIHTAQHALRRIEDELTERARIR